jgi:K+/H+ antiporter YhaU regulatory subunit KhtT
MVFNPAPAEALGAGDILVTLGQRHQLAKLETLARG